MTGSKLFHPSHAGRGMKDAKYANDIARKENDTALEAVKKSGKIRIITLPLRNWN
jgi:hypothetical protein